MGDLVLGLEPEQAMQCGIAADFGQAGVIRSVPQQGGQHRDAPEQRDGIVVPPASPARHSPCRRELSGMASRQRRIVPRDGESSSAAQANRGCVSMTFIVATTPTPGAYSTSR